MRVFLAGVPVHSSLVVELAQLVREPELTKKLELGVEQDAIAIRLDQDERAIVLQALGNPPPGLEDVRDTLLAQQVRRPDGDVRAAEQAA
jgi:hypothetical protein